MSHNMFHIFIVILLIALTVNAQDIEKLENPTSLQIQGQEPIALDQSTPQAIGDPKDKPKE